jgi:chemotaxis response regulator CheB
MPAKFEMESIELHLQIQECVQNGWLLTPSVPSAEPAFGNATQEASNATRQTDGIELPAISEKHSIKVMVVDDNMIIRKILKKILHQDAGIQEVVECKSVQESLERLPQFHPDVVALDVLFPDMNGAAAALRLRQIEDVPVIMLASHSAEGMEITMQCLAGAAMDFIGKPGDEDHHLKNLGTKASWIIAQLHRVARLGNKAIPKPPPWKPVQAWQRVTDSTLPAQKLILLGGATGGYPALLDMLGRLTSLTETAVLVVQYMSEYFLSLFLDEIKKYCTWPISKARVTDPIKENHVYVVPAPAFATTVVSKNDQLFFNVEVNPDMLQDTECHSTFFHCLESAMSACHGRVMTLILPGIGIEILEDVKPLIKKGAYIVFLDDWAASFPSALPAWTKISQIERDRFLSLLECKSAFMTRRL